MNEVPKDFVEAAEVTTMVYLRCANDHANSVPMSDRSLAVGRACSRCGQPLLAEPPRDPYRRRF